MRVQKVLIVGFVWPEPNSSAAGSRMMQLLDLFRRQHWEIIFASTASNSDFAFDLELVGITKAYIKLNDSAFDIFITELNPDIVLFDRFMTEEQFGWRVAEFCPNALRILDTEDLHCLRHARHEAMKKGRDFEIDDIFTDIARREIASILRSDVSLMISHVEMDLLINTFKVDPQLLYYLPFLLENIGANEIDNWLDYESRQHFIFVGNFHHEPNKDAVFYLKERIWPLIKNSLPAAEIHIYGAYAPQQVLQLHQPKDRFHIKGRALNAADVVKKARIVLAPLRFGAGIKGKFTEAMFCGTPSITTLIGAESMHGSLDWSGFIEDDPETLAVNAVNLYSDKTLWLEKQFNGIKIINTIYDKHKLGEGLVGYIEQLDLITHRKHNFIGSILNHSALSATKYMSRWIECKNK